MRRFLLSATAMLLVLLLQWPGAAHAITAPELRGSKSMQDLSSDMHGRNLQQKEFLKMDLEGTDFSQSDLIFRVLTCKASEGKVATSRAQGA